jgi:hypothetical protein
MQLVASLEPGHFGGAWLRHMMYRMLYNINPQPKAVASKVLHAQSSINQASKHTFDIM